MLFIIKTKELRELKGLFRKNKKTETRDNDIALPLVGILVS